LSKGTDGAAIVYCEGALGTSNGKTAHGLLRFTTRYDVLSVVDSRHAGKDSGEVLDGKPNGIPVVPSVAAAVEAARDLGAAATHLVIGLAPDGGRLPPSARKDVATAIRFRLNVDSGLHDFLGDDPELSELAREHGVIIRDVRRPPDRNDLHFFSGKIAEVTSGRIAVLGTDSAVGKRTTAVLLVRGLREAGLSAEMIGTGQTAWMQGVKHGLILDSLINDFISGEIEHAVWSAWNEERPRVIVLEGQGSLMNPAYPGGFELLAAGRPHGVVLQHAPARREYDGFPGFPIHPLDEQIRAIELISGKPVIAVTLNHEGMTPAAVGEARRRIAAETGRPAFDVLLDGPAGLAETVRRRLGL
jgi:uncharacterized NAD-dependent epimerase/dehydratase family protein